MKKWTVRAFVEDMLSDGRTPKEIIAIAQSTRWKGDIKEVKEIIKSFSKKFKERFQIIDKNDDNRVKSKN